MVNINLNCAEATALVNRLSSLIQEDNEDTTVLPLAYTAQGVGIHQGSQGGHGHSRAVHTTTTITTHESPSPLGHWPTLHNERHHSSPAPTGFEHNRGAAHVPFNITDHNGWEVPAQYIQVHMSTDDPYVLAHATLHGPIYGGQLHAAPVNNLNTPIEPLADVAMCMFAEDFLGRQHVDGAVTSINDHTLIAELKWHWWLTCQIADVGLECKCLKWQVFQLGLEQGMSCNCLQEAHTGDWIIEEMMQDMHHYTDVPVPNRCGHCGHQT